MNADASEYGDSTLSTDLVVESPTARMAITEPTPMMSPSMVSSERSLLVHSAANAWLTNSTSLFMAQALDRREPCGARGRVGAEEDADEHREAHRREQYREPVDGGRRASELADEEGVGGERRRHADDGANHAADERDRHGLG